MSNEKRAQREKPPSPQWTGGLERARDSPQKDDMPFAPGVNPVELNVYERSAAIDGVVAVAVEANARSAGAADVGKVQGAQSSSGALARLPGPLSGVKGIWKLPDSEASTADPPPALPRLPLLPEPMLYNAASIGATLLGTVFEADREEAAAAATGGE